MVHALARTMLHSRPAVRAQLPPDERLVPILRNVYGWQVFIEPHLRMGHSLFDVAETLVEQVSEAVARADHRSRPNSGGGSTCTRG